MKIKWAAATLFLILLALVSACDTQYYSTPAGQTADPSPSVTNTTPSASYYQNIVDSMRSLIKENTQNLPEAFEQIQNPSNGPGYLPRPAGAFNINLYFTVLDHLSMQPGYTLDYLYEKDYMGGAPHVYARKSDAAPFNDGPEMEEAILSTYPGSETMDSLEQSNIIRDAYLERVQADDTPEGYFQLLVLRTMGCQFYLWWHAGYNDSTIVCEQPAVGKLLEGWYMAEDERTPELLRQISQFDHEPRITIGESSAAVTVNTFTKWGGLIQKEYTISRQFPHEIREGEAVTLVQYDSGLRF